MDEEWAFLLISQSGDTENSPLQEQVSPRSHPRYKQGGVSRLCGGNGRLCLGFSVIACAACSNLWEPEPAARPTLEMGAGQAPPGRGGIAAHGLVPEGEGGRAWRLLSTFASKEEKSSYTGCALRNQGGCLAAEGICNEQVRGKLPS